MRSVLDIGKQVKSKNNLTRVEVGKVVRYLCVCMCESIKLAYIKGNGEV